MQPQTAAGSPVVSVVIPYYDAAKWLPETLRSVFAQSFQDFEVILVNDGSPDTPALEALLRALPLAQRQRISCVSQDNRGPSAARNHGLRLAHGKLIALLDADDLWAPTFLARTVAAMSEAPAADLVYSDAWVVDDRGGTTHRFSDRHPSSPAPTLAEVLGGESTVVTSAVVADRHALLAAGGFNEALNRSEDFDLWVRLLLAGARFRAIQEPLIQRRKHAGGLSADEGLMGAAAMRVIQGHVDAGHLSGAALAASKRLFRMIDARRSTVAARAALTRGDTRAARQLLRRAFRAHPTVKLAVANVGLMIAPAFVAWWVKRSESGAATSP